MKKIAFKLVAAISTLIALAMAAGATVEWK